MSRWLLLALLAGSLWAVPANAERTWVYHPDPGLIQEREFAYAIDGVHRKAYRFGGTVDGVLNNQLKRQDLDDPELAWSPVSAPGGPPARFLSRAWFDQRRNRILILGGYDADTTGHADVWVYDIGSGTWSQPPVGNGGPASILGEFPFAYDSRRDRLLYLNGEATDQHPRVWNLDLTADTLTWSSFDPTSSFQLVPEIGLPTIPRLVSSAAYDSLGDRLLLMAPYPGNGLYKLDLSNPTAFVVTGITYQDYIPRIAVDAVHNRLLIDLRDQNLLGPILQVLDLPSLLQLSIQYDPPNRPWDSNELDLVHNTLAWDVNPIAGSLEVEFRQSGRVARHTLDFESLTWSYRRSTERVRAVDDVAGAIDPVDRAIYVYGGSIRGPRPRDGVSTDSVLFRLDADDPNVQELIHPMGEGPGPLSGAVAVLDSVGRRVVFLGGSDASGTPRSEVWALDLEPQPQWSRIVTAAQGPDRIVAATIDPAARTVYVLGRSTPTGWMWALDLSATPAEWTRLMDTGPEYVTSEQIGYDRAHHRILGVAGAGYFAIDLEPTPALTYSEYPPPGPTVNKRYSCMGAFDLRRNVMFTHGGYWLYPSTSSPYGTHPTAVWTGTMFRDAIAQLGEVPPTVVHGLMLYDPIPDRLLILNGDQVGKVNGDFTDRFGMFGVWTLDLDDAVPARVDLADVAVQPQGVRIRFSGASAESPLHVDRSIDGTNEWTWIGDAREVSPELFEWTDATVVAGTRYRYRARFLSGGMEETTATSEVVAIPGAVEFVMKAAGGAVGPGWPIVLEGRVQPGIPARVELIDVSGRVVARHAVTSTFTASLAPQRPSAGIYFARLVQGDRTAVLKLVRF